MNIKKIVETLVKKHDTRSPFRIAEWHDIKIIRCNLKSVLGYYTKYRRVQSIILNSHLSEYLENFVCAHELGHAICHPNLNVQWLCENTLYSKGIFERQANTFAVELLLSDDLLREHPGCSIYNVAESVGVPKEFVTLKAMNT